MVSTMWGMLRSVAVLAVVATACNSSGTPATTPPTATTTTTSTTIAPSSTTTTPEATTTTVDRLTEIEATFQDLEERRLQALYDGDRDAFRALFANDEYRERSMEAFEVVEFVDDWTMPTVAVLEVLSDQAGCIAVATSTDFTNVFEGSEVGEWIEVVQKTPDGWGLSYAGEGWKCSGPHPLSP
jgi:hypothetical protein